jgi:imidazolonepropionase-like amidohydrolase
MKVLTGATLFDGTGAQPLENAVVIVENDRILEVGVAPSISFPAEAEVFDLKGLTLLPGLIDVHDHLGHNDYALMDRWELDAPNSYRHIRTANVLEEVLDMGYTAVRDGGGLDIGFKRAVSEGLIPGPRLSLSLSLISPTGGLSDIRTPSFHCCPRPTSLTLPSGVADGPDAVRTKVREMCRLGADVIKCASTGGASSRDGHGPLDREFNKDELEALVDEAHKQGRRVMCHALGGPGLRQAVEAGVDSIEHGTYLNRDPELFSIMAGQNIYYVPTLLVYVFHRDNVRQEVKIRARTLYNDHIQSVQQAQDAGVKVVAGTDSGGWGHPPNAGELECLVNEAGLDTKQVLLAATGIAAQCLGWEKDIGTIEKGKLADLLAVKGDPLKDIRILKSKKNIKLVLKGGAIHRDTR